MNEVCPFLKAVCIKSQCALWTTSNDLAGKCGVRVIAETNFLLATNKKK